MSLPTSGRAYLDASLFIYTVERHPIYLPTILPLWQGMVAGSLAVVTSELTLMEVLVGAYRKKDTTLASDYLQALGDPPIRKAPIDESILSYAAQLRALHGSLRTPDAIHVATATLMGCDLFVTNDKGLRNVFPSVVVLDDLT